MRLVFLALALLVAGPAVAQPLPFVESFEPGFELARTPTWGWYAPPFWIPLTVDSEGCNGFWRGESGTYPDGAGGLLVASQANCTKMGPAFCFDRNVAETDEVGVEVWIKVAPGVQFDFRVGGLMNSDIDFCCQPSVIVSQAGGRLSIGDWDSPLLGPPITDEWHLLRMEFKQGSICVITWDGVHVITRQSYGVRGMRFGVWPGTTDGTFNKVRYDGLRVFRLANEPVSETTGSMGTLKRRY